jgi:predicted nucleic acid-binding Zn ribbon protein
VKAKGGNTGPSDKQKYDKPWKPWRPKHRPGPGDAPETIADLMGATLARLGGEGRALEFRVFEVYNRVVGELLRTRTAPERIAGTTLFVRVANSALAHELTLMRAEIMTKMNADLGAGTVTELRTRVGKVDG